jgi:ectoine hydroxylase-related dioxygenase (phytanoyl-CoA dioxygenase family)
VTLTTQDTELTRDQVGRFHREGYLGPFCLCSEAEMAQRRVELERVLVSDPDIGRDRRHNRHLDAAAVWELASHAAITSRMQALIGPDLLLWRTHFFVKEPARGDDASDGKEVPWHQDANYWPLEPAVIASAWIAIDPATRANGCLQLIPGSHRATVPHIPAGDDMLFAEMADPDHVDAAAAIDLEMAPGQFLLFNERTLHHSAANLSADRRIGLAVRVVPPIVEVLSYDGDGHGLVPMKGSDTMGLNRLAEAPV